MTASRISARLALAGALALLLCWGPRPALAQEEMPLPIPLLPPKEAPKTPPPVKEEPRQGETEGEAERSIAIESLSALDPDSWGLLDEANGGFGPKLWAGARRSLIEKLLPRLPAGAASAAMHDLARRLLLSAAPPPEGPASVSLLELRAERLAALGDYGAAVDLLKAAPARPLDEKTARLETEWLLLAGDPAGACERARSSVQEFEDLFWHKVLIFCQALAGQYDAATLGLSLLREEERADDRAFFALARILLGASEEPPPTSPRITPLDFAMLRAARVPVSARMLDAMSPALLRATALTVEGPIEVRLEAGERAEALGVLSAEALRELYMAAPFTPEELANPLSRAEEMEGPRGRALLYQASRSQAVPVARAEALEKTWALARSDGLYMTAARVSLAAALEVEAAPELAWFAEEAARALFAGGRSDRAKEWLRLAREAAPANPQEASSLLALWPLARLADANRSLDPGMLSSWWDAQQDVPEPERRERASLFYSLLDALGINVPAEYWERLVPGPARLTTTVPAPPLRQALIRASTNARLGETVLLALLVLGHGGPAGASEPTLAAVIEALRVAGLSEEARHLALEAALAAGF